MDIRLPPPGQPLPSRLDLALPVRIDLQVRIHHAAAIARAIRFGIPVLLTAWLVCRLSAPYVRPNDLVPQPGEFYLLMTAVAVAGGLFLGPVCGFALSLPLAWGVRVLLGRRVRDRIEALPARHQAGVLQPLRSLEGDAGTIADRLIVELRLDRYATEVTACEAAEGRGSELSAGP